MKAISYVRMCAEEDPEVEAREGPGVDAALNAMAVLYPELPIDRPLLTAAVAGWRDPASGKWGPILAMLGIEDSPTARDSISKAWRNWEERHKKGTAFNEHDGVNSMVPLSMPGLRLPEDPAARMAVLFERRTHLDSGAHMRRRPVQDPETGEWKMGPWELYEPMKHD
jgi:hypothetical protein